MTEHTNRSSSISHAHRELELMLQGIKPLAVFCHENIEGFEKHYALSSQDFQRHVQLGQIEETVKSRSWITDDGSERRIDYWFYTLPGHHWRVEAYWLLLEMLHERGWCSHLEWLQGTLLGYTDEQNKSHLSQKYPRGDPHQKNRF